MAEKLRIACIGAGSSGAGQMILMEKMVPGSVVAFCDRDRTLFDKIVNSYLGGNAAAEVGDFKTEVNGLRTDFRDIPFYTDPDEMLEKEEIDAVIIATWCCSHYEMVEKCVRRGKHILLEKPIAISEEDVEKCWSLLDTFSRSLSAASKKVSTTLSPF